MYFADYHTHSAISPDAFTSMMDMAKAAVEAGVQELCFTDHVDPVHWDLTPRTSFDWATMQEAFRQAQNAWGDRIQLRLGMELGDATMDLPLTEAMLSDRPELDFVIGSVHRLGRAYSHEDLYNFHPKTEEEAYKAIDDYFQVMDSLVNWGHFHVLGHLTLPLRYLNEQQGFSLTFDGYRDQIASIFETLIGKGLGIELNVNRGGLPLPHDTWLRLYRDLGGRRITLGSDAHTPTHIGVGIPQGQALLQHCGFNVFCTFDKGQEVWHKLG